MNVKAANSKRFGGLLRTAHIGVEDLSALVAAADLSDLSDLEGIQELFASAVCRNNFEKVTVFLDAGVKPGSSVMLEAARSGPADMLDRLLTAGGDPNAREWHLSPLIEAVERMDAKKVSLLLDAGATPTAKAMTQAATHRDPDILVQLLAAGGDPNGGELSTRPLHVAAFRNFAESVSILLEAGADPNKECEGTFPLHWACLAGGTETVALLLESGADPHAKCIADHSPRDRGRKYYKSGDAPIDLIYSDSSVGTLDALLRAGVDPNHKSEVSGLSILHSAAMYGGDAFIAKLLEAGADPNQPSSDGDMPLHGAAETGRTDVLSTLMAAGADPNGRGYDGNSPLQCAAREGHSEVVEALMAAGADPNHVNQNGETPLHSVCSFLARNIYSPRLGETARLLLETGLDPNARDNRGETPLFKAAGAADEYGDVIRSSIELVENLVEYGADILAKNDKGKTASFYAFHQEVQAHLVTAEAQARQHRLEAKIQEVGELAPSKRQSSDGPCLIVGGDLFNPREVAKAPAPTALQEPPLQRMRL